MVGQTSTLDEPRMPPRPAGRITTLRVLWSAGRVREDPPIEFSEEIRIGRDPAANGCVLEDPHVSRQHAVLFADPSDAAATLRNLSRRGSHVAGQRVDDTARVADGQVLVIGHSLLLFRVETRPIEDAPEAAKLIGSAPAMRTLRARAALLAPTDGVVRIQGATGTGKELVAETLHGLSGRSGPFVPVNCAAIPDTLAESALFGHVGGAFTGATQSAKGWFRGAAHGTLFLDEIGELPLTQQAKLLRALESGRVIPVGSTEEIPHHARVITATHRDLTSDVREGRFRADLYSRVSDFVLEVPSLAARPEDTLPLLRHGFSGPLPPLDFALARALLEHPWPLNVRELMRIAKQLETFGAGRAALTLDLVEASLARSVSLLGDTTDSEPPPADDARGSDRPPSREALEELLREHRGVVADVARQVGRSRKQVYRWLRSQGLDLEDYREG
ncbi:MAG: sigma 54-interacting transcriptional regulator [Sandaracinaceae bacterium]|nr:sigma 54-interacting transcriptional regulator [Sandaracinaceae bacterium]